jgi:hypothetical protein
MGTVNKTIAYYEGCRLLGCGHPSVTTYAVGAFKEDTCLKTQKNPYVGAAVANMSRDLSLQINKCIPLQLPNNPNYILKPMQSHPKQNVTRTGPKTCIREEDHETVTLWQRQNTAKKENTG